MEPQGDSQVDISLLQRVVARDASAIGELYDRHSRLLFGLIVRILRDRGEAEEVLQDVLVVVWNRAETYDAALGLPLGWLVRIARNRAIDRLRSNDARMRVAESAASETPLPESPEARAWCGEQQRAVARALGALPIEQRRLIEDAYFLGLTQSELAERHTLPLGTVKTRIRTGLLTLRQHLSPTFAAQ